jgi:hypothetical protein
MVYLKTSNWLHQRGRPGCQYLLTVRTCCIDRVDFEPGPTMASPMALSLPPKYTYAIYWDILGLMQIPPYLGVSLIRIAA